MRIKCAVACTNEADSPDFFRVIIDCTEEQRDNAEHYEAAEAEAEAAGYIPSLAFAEGDDGWKHLSFDWNDVSIVYLPGPQDRSTGGTRRN